MKSRKLGIALLLMLALVVTSGTFAYWASSISGDAATQSGASVTIGEGNAVTTTVTVTGPTAGGATGLVPTAYAATAGVEDTATFTYAVDWDADSAEAGSGFTGDLAVTFSNKSLGTLTPAEIDAMFNFVVTSGDGAITEGAAPGNVVITVTFATEPATQAIYNEVALGTLTFDATFTVTPD
jgi:hypothetical protein